MGEVPLSVALEGEEETVVDGEFASLPLVVLAVGWLYMSETGPEVVWALPEVDLFDEEDFRLLLLFFALAVLDFVAVESLVATVGAEWLWLWF